MWTFESHREGGWNLDVAIERLFAQLPDSNEIWTSLCSRFRVDVFCGLFMGNDNQSDAIGSATIQLLSARGVALGLDVYGAFGEHDA